MVKSKRRQLAALAASREHSLGGFVESSHSVTEEDLHLDSDWVIVKKQKITILIPSLQPITTQGRRKNHIQRKPKKTTKRRPPIHNEIHLQKHSSDEFHEADAVASKVDSQIDRENLVIPSDPINDLPIPAPKAAPKGPNRLVEDSMRFPSSLNQVRDQRIWGARTSSQPFVVSGVQKAVNRPTLPSSIYRQGPTLFPRSIGCLNVGVIQNKKMRASNLERKLEKAGGLSRWLLSLRLGQFVQMFRRKNVDKYQLLNLTMAQLKDMGILAVGPRRKLIHAIECLSQPYCFKNL